MANQEIVASELASFAAAHVPDHFTGPPGLFEEPEDLTELMAIQRVDSSEVVFENKLKKAKVLNHYVMGDVLGEGSYAKVKEAVDSRNLCRRAIKIMKRKKLRRIPHGEQNVEQEIKLLNRLSHPNIMELIEVFRNDEKGKIYMVLEYCCTVLKDMLDASDLKCFPAWQAHFYFRQLIKGLEYLHANGVVHKDIKPGNLLLNTGGTLKIADFGVAEVLDRFAPDDYCTTSQGTPAFQPPEIANGAKCFPGFKIDVWSSGITLFNFVTGDYPFNGDTIFRLFEDIGRCELVIPPGIDPVLTDLLQNMLKKEPDERYSLPEIQSHDWFKKQHPMSSPPVTVPSRDDDDQTLSTTVIPYLCELHFGSQFIHEPKSDEEGLQFITEHEVKARAQAQEAAQDGNGEVEKSAKNKEDGVTTNCIKFKQKDCVIM